MANSIQRVEGTDYLMIIIVNIYSLSIFTHMSFADPSGLILM